MTNEEQVETESVRAMHIALRVLQMKIRRRTISFPEAEAAARSVRRSVHGGDLDDHDDHDDEISKPKAALTLERRKNAKLTEKVATLQSELAAARGVRQDVMVNSDDEGFI